MIWTAIVAWLVCGLVSVLVSEAGGYGVASPRPCAVVVAACRSLDFVLAVHGLSRRQRLAKVAPKLFAMLAVVVVIGSVLWPLGIVTAWRRSRIVGRGGRNA